MSPASEIKTIFWDIGGVLLTNGWDVHQRAEVLTRLGVNLADYESRHEAANFCWERGLSTAEHFFNQTVFHQPRSFTFEDLWPQVCAESKILSRESLEILGTLYDTRQFKLATLNNESRELNEHRLNAFRLRPYFDYFI
ncbi:MAG: HAD family phosphatase, partial [Edaphobacter sp.]